MTNKNERLDAASLDFITIALSLGYTIDKAKSSKKIAILVSESKRLAVYDNGARGHYYVNQKDESEKGSIIDLVKRDLNFSFIQAKDYITKGQGAPIHSGTPRQESAKEAEKGEKRDFSSVYSKSRYPNESEYLTNEREIPAPLLVMSEDTRQGTDTNLFFHRDGLGEVTGYEFRGFTKKGFSKNGKKALFTLTLSEKIETIVIVESAINAFSYASLLLIRDDIDERFLNSVIVSTAGRFSANQKAQIQALAEKYTDAMIIFAQDNDTTGDGDKQAQELKEALLGRRTTRHKPRLNDFNDDLKAYFNG